LSRRRRLKGAGAAESRGKKAGLTLFGRTKP
jgi:hypothetical protein